MTKITKIDCGMKKTKIMKLKEPRYIWFKVS